MKRWVFVNVLCIVFYLNPAKAQTMCGSLRYQDSIFHSVDTIQGIYFATANPFGLNPSQDLYLDIYQPANDTQKHRPLIVFQHGGSFLNGSRNQTIIPAYATYFAKCGYVVASIDYRLGFDPLSTGSAERAVYRAIQDLRASIRFLCQHSDQYGIDTNSVILDGNSAGCISGLCSAFIKEQQFPSTIHGTFTESGDLGPIDSSGNHDFGDRYVKPRAIISHWGAILDTGYITLADSLPVLCIQGTADASVPYISGHPYSYPIFPVVYGSLPVTRRLTDLHVRNKLVALIGKGHEPETQDPTINDTMNNEGREFLLRVIKPLTPVISGRDTICHQLPAIYSVTKVVGSKYCWQLSGNGTITQDLGDTINVLWNDTGMVSVTVTEINYMGAEADPISYRTRVLPPVKASFTFGIYQLQGRFINTSKYESSVVWSFGNGDTSSAYYPVEAFTPGTYNVALVALNERCSVSDTFVSTIVVDTCPWAHFTYQTTGLTGFFIADTSNTVLYDWNFGDGSEANVTTPHVLHQYQQGGIYRVILNEMSTQGCQNSDTTVIQIFNTSVEETPENSVNVLCDLLTGCKINFTESGQWTLEVFDLLGRQLKRQQISDNYLLLSSEFQPGIYLLKLTNGDQNLVTKFVKQ